jgi:hypothetical protein
MRRSLEQPLSGALTPEHAKVLRDLNTQGKLTEAILDQAQRETRVVRMAKLCLLCPDKVRAVGTRDRQLVRRLQRGESSVQVFVRHEPTPLIHATQRARKELSRRRTA